MASKIPFLFHPPQKDEVIIFRHPEIGLAIKRIETFDAETDQVTVLGTHSYSIDSRHFGPIPKCLILGKVLWHIHPKR